ncbi:myb-like protein x [Anaeramoeba flamelloides]|uniref:Myb-like protein x n=1 Tax=Anaeramoeba flamelloides TaxID=1746091 RepID=A0ABQ8XQ27_9EUKA|nr:myb-like protein x [Anaeramoeba flamelloides]
MSQAKKSNQSKNSITLKRQLKNLRSEKKILQSLLIWSSELLDLPELTLEELFSENGIILLKLMNVILPTEEIIYVKIKHKVTQIRENIGTYLELAVNQYNFPKESIFSISDLINKPNITSKIILQSLQWIKQKYKANGPKKDLNNNKRLVRVLHNDLTLNFGFSEQLIKKFSQRNCSKITIKNDLWGKTKIIQTPRKKNFNFESKLPLNKININQQSKKMIKKDHKQQKQNKNNLLDKNNIKKEQDQRIRKGKRKGKGKENEKEKEKEKENEIENELEKEKEKVKGKGKGREKENEKKNEKEKDQRIRIRKGKRKGKGKEKEKENENENENKKEKGKGKKKLKTKKEKVIEITSGTDKKKRISFSTESVQSASDIYCDHTSHSQLLEKKKNQKLVGSKILEDEFNSIDLVGLENEQNNEPDFNFISDDLNKTQFYKRTSSLLFSTIKEEKQKFQSTNKNPIGKSDQNLNLLIQIEKIEEEIPHLDKKLIKIKKKLKKIKTKISNTKSKQLKLKYQKEKLQEKTNYMKYKDDLLAKRNQILEINKLIQNIKISDKTSKKEPKKKDEEKDEIERKKENESVNIIVESLDSLNFSSNGESYSGYDSESDHEPKNLKHQKKKEKKEKKKKNEKKNKKGEEKEKKDEIERKKENKSVNIIVESFDSFKFLLSSESDSGSDSFSDLDYKIENNKKDGEKKKKKIKGIDGFSGAKDINSQVKLKKKKSVSYKKKMKKKKKKKKKKNKEGNNILLVQTLKNIMNECDKPSNFFVNILKKKGFQLVVYGSTTNPMALETVQELFDNFVRSEDDWSIIETFFFANTENQWSQFDLSLIKGGRKFKKKIFKIKKEFENNFQESIKWCRIGSFLKPIFAHVNLSSKWKKVEVKFDFQRFRICFKKRMFNDNKDSSNNNNNKNEEAVLFQGEWNLEKFWLLLDLRHSKKILLINDQNQKMNLKFMEFHDKRVFIFMLMIYIRSNGRDPVILNNPKTSIPSNELLNFIVYQPLFYPQDQKDLDCVYSLENIRNIKNLSRNKNKNKNQKNEAKNSKTILKNFWNKGQIIFLLHIIVGRIVPLHSVLLIIDHHSINLQLSLKQQKIQFHFSDNIEISADLTRDRCFELRKITSQIKKQKKFRLVAISNGQRKSVIDAISFFYKQWNLRYFVKNVKNNKKKKKSNILKIF